MLLIVAAFSQIVVAQNQSENSVTYYENTEIKQSEGKLNNGHPDGRWKYYSKSGKIYKEVDYFMGVVNGRVAYYYENGKLKNEGSIFNNKATGSYKEYYENGTIKSEGIYNQNVKDSVWNYYNILGKLILREVWTDGSSKITDAYDNQGNQLVKNGNGNFVSYFPDEKTVKEQGAYKDGKKDGNWTTFYVNGKTASKITYTDGNPTGQILTFYEDGSKRSEEHVENGVYKLWFQNGNLQTEGFMKNNERDGHWVAYDESGTKLSEGDYVQGKKNGLHTIYFYNGEKESEINYKNGEKDGHAVWYRRDTTKKSSVKMVKHIEGNFVGDVQNGHWIYYQIDGTIGNEGEYLDGKMSGLWTWYYDGKKIWKTANYQNGERNGLYTVYYENGQVYYTGNYKDNKEEGFWKRFHENGKPEIQGCFHDGKQDSVWKEWFDNGVLRYEINYVQNKKDGVVIYTTKPE